MSSSDESKTALIFGVTGQDGSYLSELLVDQGYNVVGVNRHSSTDTTGRLEEVKDDITIVEGDLLDPSSICSLIHEHQPDEIYNLAAQSHVGTSFKQPVLTFQVNAVGVLNILEGVRTTFPSAKIYQASTSEMFGDNYTEKYKGNPELNEVWIGGIAAGYNRFQDEDTQFAPRSPYAVAKMAAHNLVHTYRESYGLHASCGILFNHESERRGGDFVTRKITKYIAGIVRQFYTELGKKDVHWVVSPASAVEPLALGNLDAKRDWGHAVDYVRAMWLMLQQEEPDDYVISTGKTHSIRKLLDVAFGYVGVKDWKPYVVIDPQFYRPADVEYLCGNSKKAKEKLGWEPEISFEQLIEGMLEHDIQMAQEAAGTPIGGRTH